LLPLYGRAILPELREKFDHKGRGGHVRRLMLMHRLDPEGTRETVKRALDEGSKEMRVAAIECLDDSAEHLSFLLDQVKSKAKAICGAALKALGRFKSPDAVKSLCAALKGDDIELAVEPVRASRDPQLLQFVLQEANDQLGTLLTGKEKDKAKLARQAARMLSLLECLRGRDDTAAEAFLIDVFAQRDKLASIKGDPGGKDVVQRLVSVMAGGPKKAQQSLVDAHASLAEDDLAEAFTAAVRSRTPREVFDLFSPYLTAKVDEKKKKRDPAFLKREAILGVLTGNRSGYARHYYYAIATDDELLKSLDPRWLDLAVKQQNLELVQSLAVPNHAAANRLLSQALEQFTGYPGAADAATATITKFSRSTHHYGLYWIVQLIPELPKESLPKFDALLPTLPDKVIDQVLDYVTQLRNRQD
jgi:hypothetical protein